MSDESFRIPISKIGPNMILSKDVITQDGAVLIPKNTSLNNVNISRLRSLGIEYVSIKPATPKRLIKAKNAPRVIEKIEFINFEDEYSQRTEQYKSLIQDISGGKSVDVSELYKLTDDILQSLNFRNDVFTFMSHIKQTDGYLFTHCINVSILCNIFARWLRLRPKAVMELTVAGLLHDIGMTKLPEGFVEKKAALSPAELSRMREHPTDGYRLLTKQPVSDAVRVAVLLHHERMDGTGYPLKVRAEKISAYAKILSICDMYDAMTSDRPYRDRIPPFRVIRTLETGMYSELDTRYLLVFLQNIAYNYLGSWVQLSDGRQAEIMFINRLNISKPIVRTTQDEMLDLTAAGLEITALL